MKKIEDLYMTNIESEENKIERYLYEHNVDYHKLSKKYSLLEDVFKDMLDEESAKHYEKIIACRTEIDQLKMNHVFHKTYMIANRQDKLKQLSSKG